MTIEQFETYSLYLGLSALIAYCVFIMHKLAKDSNAGKFGTFVIFFALGFGILGFVIKEVIIHLMQ